MTKMDHFFMVSMAFATFALVESAYVVVMATNIAVSKGLNKAMGPAGELLDPKTWDKISRWFFVIVYLILCAEILLDAAASGGARAALAMAEAGAALAGDAAAAGQEQLDAHTY